ncbi:carbamate kinase [Parvibaculum lavamentivorans DS-1]|uniref:Carbamate kinase n=1 Tax=Parvibaculum lavamentivorans (strain DS-1 / DSM 13023 / NCIMB 13966) TaxID=402881 RepID=A7HS83_PARL1|nr:carbamate kinase [Parvibaculum lavamentivorans]ABS62766.1 carbamate kinase [Parvibaculum lavamentivorans DS-1]
MRVLVAIGGNALLKRGEMLAIANQRRNMADAAAPLAVIAREHEMVLVHGNGPQVGLLALEADAYKDAPAYPLDVLGAESQGMIGFVIEEAMRRFLPDKEIVAVLTQTLVDPGDPAFAAPSKPIGPVYDEETAKALAAERGWSVAPDGKSWRRVVASPAPQRIVELASIRRLVESGCVVICAGGGGIPVRPGPAGAPEGIEAVIDKDLAARLLAVELAADCLVILTDVDGLYENWGKPGQRLLKSIAARDLDPASFASGSMRPKVEAVRGFVEATGRPAFIGSLAEAAALIAGRAGTRIEP